MNAVATFSDRGYDALPVLFDRGYGPTSATPNVARHELVRAIESLGLADEPAQAVQLVLSELVTNSVLHARTDLRVRVAADDEVVVVAVADEDPRIPSRRRYEADAATGRGLGLCDALSVESGASRTENGKLVWYVVPRSGHYPESRIENWESTALPAGPDPFAEIVLGGLPVELYKRWQSHVETLLRELILLTYDPPPDLDPGFKEDLRVAQRILEGLAAELAGVFGLDPRIAAVDVVVTLPLTEAAAARVLGKVIDTAVVAGRAGHLMPIVNPASYRELRVWLLNELAEQGARGSAPRRYEPRNVLASV